MESKTGLTSPDPSEFYASQFIYFSDCFLIKNNHIKLVVACFYYTKMRTVSVDDYMSATASQLRLCKCQYFSTIYEFFSPEFTETKRLYSLIFNINTNMLVVCVQWLFLCQHWVQVGNKNKTLLFCVSKICFTFVKVSYGVSTVSVV